MAAHTIDQVRPRSAPAGTATSWLRSYYFGRFAFSAAWVVLAFSVARSSPALSAVLLVGYPLWDALANLVDAQRSGGLSENRSQLFNFLVSLVTTASVAIALGHSMNTVLIVFGVWAALSGVLQLATATGRWKAFGAQWAMILSGAQSALAGVFMIKMALGAEPVGIANIAPYAAFGAFYFLVSAVSLTVAGARQAKR